jgi:ATP-dependent HslUV protease subunit HslV
MSLPKVHSTTVLCVRHQGKVAMASDGQVTFDTTVVKHTARKIRRLRQESVLVGFAGSAADAFALLGRFEAKLDQYGALQRAAVELAKDWRTDKALRQLQALLIAADAESTVLLSGTGDVIEPDDGLVAVGSGGAVALAAARALVARAPDLEAAEIARTSLEIAAGIDIHTNDHIVVEEL